MKTLLIGNTAYLTEEFIGEAFPHQSVFIYGETSLRSSSKRNRTVFTKHYKEKNIEAIFDYYSYDQVVFLSDYLNYGSKSEGELEYLDRFLRLLSTQQDLRFLYLSSPILKTAERDLSKITEEFVLDWAEKTETSLKVVHLPYLYSAANKNDYLYRLLCSIEEGKELIWSESPQSQASFLSLSDLAELLHRMFERWTPEREVLVVEDPFQVKFADLAQELKKLYPQLTIHFSEIESIRSYMNGGETGQKLRDEYGWFVHYSVLKDLPFYYQDYQKSKHTIEQWLRPDSILNFLVLRSKLQQFMEVIILFVLFEGLRLLAQTQLQFQLVDLRLLFVVVTSSVFGTGLGLLASLLASLALSVSLMYEGASWQLLLYNTDRWGTFVAYLFVALVTGYVSMKNRDDQEFLKKQVGDLSENMTLLDQAYETVLEDYQQLQVDLLGSSGGFAQFYHYFERLDQKTEEKVLLEARALAEEIVGSPVMLYAGTMERAVWIFGGTSRDPQNLSTLELLYPSFEKGEVWMNHRCLEDYPAFAFSVKGRYYFLVEKVSFEKIGRDQKDRLEVLARMTTSFLDKAIVLEDRSRSQGGI